MFTGWSNFHTSMQTFNGVPDGFHLEWGVYPSPNKAEVPDSIITSDASGGWGFGAFHANEWFQIVIPPHYTSLQRNSCLWYLLQPSGTATIQPTTLTTSCYGLHQQEATKVHSSASRMVIPWHMNVLVWEALSASSIDQSKYTGHSFRIGTTTTVARCGIADSTIQLPSRWESTAYLLYVHTPSNSSSFVICT